MTSTSELLEQLRQELIVMRCQKYNGEIILKRNKRVISSDDVRNVPKGITRCPKYRNLWNSR